MNCKCNWVEAILAIIIIVFAYMPGSSKWVIIIAAILLLLHALICKNCQMCEEPMSMPKSSKKRRR